ncbi:DUF1097 domain-containing protein [Paraburkholderia megapolitana]|uniref:DUF1097 domain-containing protein n=1 Tax=Paraburkholderia megapolitana TaxID=420953 RepID=UPI0038BC3BA6
MNHPRTSRQGYVLITVVAAVSAAIASATALALSLPVWAMFMGWIAFFSRGLTTRSTVENLGCVWLGISIGTLAATGIGMLAPALGVGVALPIVVFAVAIVVVGIRGMPVMNNLLAYFLGLVTWFASELAPSIENVVHLAAAGAIGSTAGWVSHFAPRWILRMTGSVRQTT